MAEAICVHCGTNSDSLFKKFGNGVIKLSKCKSCGEDVDKYVETEMSIIIIDMLLLRKTVIRHVLCNANIKGVWKFMVLFILCDAYEKTTNKYLKRHSFEEKHINELELDFYLMCLKSSFEYFIFSFLVASLLYSKSLRKVKNISKKHILHCIVLASYGKLFMLPALVWSKNDPVCETFIRLFIFLSQIQVIRVTTKISGVLTAIFLIMIVETGYLVLKQIIG